MRTGPLVLAGSLLLTAFATAPAGADDGPGLRVTTPRATLRVDAGALLLGVPHGRAWGIESRLLPVRSAGATVALDLRVDDPAVRGAFLRIAWYDRAHGRPRQMLVEDSHDVLVGTARRVVLALDPPAGAVAFRVRVLARIDGGAPASAPDAVRVSRLSIEDGMRARPSLTRLR